MEGQEEGETRAEEKKILISKEVATIHVKISFVIMILGIFFGIWPHSFRHLPFSAALAYVICSVFGLFFFIWAEADLLVPRSEGEKKEKEDYAGTVFCAYLGALLFFFANVGVQLWIYFTHWTG